MRLRLYHHRDGARVAYRETGSGPALVLLHSLGLTYREWDPVVEPLATRFRLVLPDLPLHGDSEDRPRHPYTPEWLTEVIAGFCLEVGGPRLMVGGHDFGAELALRMAVAEDLGVTPARLVLMGNRLHRPSQATGPRALWRVVCRFGSVPGADVVLSHAAVHVIRPALGERLSARRNPEARDLIRHALDGVGGNANRARAWSKFVRHWPFEAQRDQFDSYAQLRMPVLLLWGEQDPAGPIEAAREALDLLADAQLRTLPGAGFLLAYDDPVDLARELIAFCG